MDKIIKIIAYVITAIIIVGIPIFIFAKVKEYIENLIIKRRCNKQQNYIIKTEPETEIIPTQHTNTSDCNKEYQKKFLLTKNEWFEWKKLKQYCDEKEYLICPKVRLLDLIEPRSGAGYMSGLGKIQSKHVDFVICNSKMYVLGIIELDDNSHNREDRKTRDQFVDDVLKSVGYKVHRTRSITEETLNFLNE